MVPCHSSVSNINCRWVYKKIWLTWDSNGTVKRHKAHLVARGFSRECGVDYEAFFHVCLVVNCADSSSRVVGRLSSLSNGGTSFRWM